MPIVSGRGSWEALRMAAKDDAFLKLAGAVRRLFHQLRALAEQVEPPVKGFSASHRAVLESLFTHGPLSVPALARARPVARQHIQVLVNDLLGWGYVVQRPNPAHKRSPLVALTALGLRRFKALVRAEKALLERMHFSLPSARLVKLSSELQTVSSDLDAWFGAR
jgi:DNA-binding MarR family transcriptional regulator